MKDIYIIAYAQNPILADAKAANECLSAIQTNPPIKESHV